MSAPDRQEAEQLVRALYREVHDRTPGVPELRDWVGQLQAGLSPAAMRRIFLLSDENRQRQARETERAAVAASGLFDAAWYLDRYRDVAAAGLDALKHYTDHGWPEDRWPNPWFDPAWYRAASALPAGENPVLHYMRDGEKQGIAPGPHFDPVWYRTAWQLPGDVSPLADFLARRFDRSVAPCARLWSVPGLADPGTPGTDPFQAFLLSGPQPPSADGRILRASGLFDDNFYALHSPDVMETKMDPLDHFCEFGWREGRQPNFYFNPGWYLATNPDAARLAVNPLVHYLLVGEPAGRRPVVFFDPAWYRDAYDIAPFTSPLAHYLANRRSQRFSPHPLFDPAWYMAQAGINVYPRRDPFSHFLVAGMHRDVAPSPAFDPAAWRRKTRGRPSRGFRNTLSPEKDNPLVNYLLATYR